MCEKDFHNNTEPEVEEDEIEEVAAPEPASKKKNKKKGKKYAEISFHFYSIFFEFNPLELLRRVNMLKVGSNI